MSVLSQGLKKYWMHFMEFFSTSFLLLFQIWHLAFRVVLLDLYEFGICNSPVTFLRLMKLVCCSASFCSILTRKEGQRQENGNKRSSVQTKNGMQIVTMLLKSLNHVLRALQFQAFKALALDLFLKLTRVMGDWVQFGISKKSLKKLSYLMHLESQTR